MNADRTDLIESGSLVLGRDPTSYKRDRELSRRGSGFETDFHGTFSFSFASNQNPVP